MCYLRNLLPPIGRSFQTTQVLKICVLGTVRRSQPGVNLPLRCRSKASPLGGIGGQQEQKMREYIDLLLEKNEVMNLTAVRTATEAWERHVLDSLALLPILDEGLQELPGSHSIIDVGSGAGLPGLILALARPQWQVTLLDSLQKRCTFIEEVVETLEVGNVRVVWARAEKAGHDAQFREKFDGAVARAVAEMRVLTELSLPFVKVGGKFFAAKGAQPQVRKRLLPPNGLSKPWEVSLKGPRRWSPTARKAKDVRLLSKKSRLRQGSIHAEKDARRSSLCDSKARRLVALQ